MGCAEFRAYGINSRKCNPLQVLRPVTVPAGQTVTFDTVALSLFCNILYLLCVRGGGETTSLQCFGTQDSGGVSDTIYGTIGDKLKFDVEFLVSGSDALLTIENNEAFPMVVTADRLVTEG